MQKFKFNSMLGIIVALGVIMTSNETLADDRWNNLVVLERFDGDLAKWDLRCQNSTAAVVTVDGSTKLQLKNVPGGTACAILPFSAPAEKYLIEFDMSVSVGCTGIFELLDGAGKPLASVTVGKLPHTVAFATDVTPESVAKWPDGTYNQITLAIDPVAKIIRCYWIDQSYSSNAYNPRKLLAAKSYSGTSAAKMSFRAADDKSSIINLDEIKVYKPDIAIIGDSVSDGKPRWSNDPSTVYRLGSLKPDQTSPPNYQLGILLGANVWVGNLGFGGSQSSELIPCVKPLIIEAGFKKIWLKIGLNDFNRGAKAEAVQKNMQAITAALIAGGINSADIYLCNCYGVAIFTPEKDSERRAYNAWLPEYCRKTGINLVDNDGTLTDYSVSPVKPKPEFNCGDGVHLSKAGSAQMAQNIYSLLKKTSAK